MTVSNYKRSKDTKVDLISKNAPKTLGFVLFIFFSLYSLSSFGQKKEPILPKKSISIIQSLIENEMLEQQIPGLSIAIVKNNTIVWSKGFGSSDIENRVKATAYTQYRSGSIGKTITATAIMQLQQQGKLRLNDTIQTFCKSFPQKKWPITVKDLLSHQSGVRAYKMINGEEDSTELNNKYHYRSITESLIQFKNDSLLFEPGTKYNYTSYGYVLLGCVIEGASGKNYLDYVTDNIFKPTGMSNTLADDPALIIPHRASGYRKINSVLRNSEWVDMSNKMPAGGFITTVIDLAKFSIGVMTAKLVSKESFGQMTKTQTLKNGDDVSYGLGWVSSFDEYPFYHLKEVSHGGGTPQMSGILYLLPQKDFSIVILSNLEGMQNRVDLCEAIAKVVLDLKNS